MILQNLCNGSEESFDNILKWAALAVQKLWIKCVTALVLVVAEPRGGQKTYNIFHV